MSTTGGRGPLGDDELGQALSRGLGRALDGDVDPAALLRGARAGARRIEHRRTVVRRGVGALVVVAMLPLGATVVRTFGPGGGSSGGEASTAAGAAYDSSAAAAASSVPAEAPNVAGAQTATTQDSERSSLEGTPAPTPRGGIPFSVKEGALARDAGDVVVPDDALLRASDLGLTEVSVTSDTGAQTGGARTLPTTVLPLCGTGSAEALAQGGRSVAWTGAGDGGTTWTASTTVRVFSGSGAADELARLRRAVGVCPGSEGVSREPVAGLPGDEVLVAVLPAQDLEPITMVGVLRRGRVTVGVRLDVPSTTRPEQDRADGVARLRALLVRADARLARFADAAQTDPTLG